MFIHYHERPFLSVTCVRTLIRPINIYYQFVLHGHSSITILPKKRDTLDPLNFCGIYLVKTYRKVFMRILTNYCFAINLIITR